MNCGIRNAISPLSSANNVSFEEFALRSAAATYEARSVAFARSQLCSSAGTGRHISAVAIQLPFFAATMGP